MKYSTGIIWNSKLRNWMIFLLLLIQHPLKTKLLSLRALGQCARNTSLFLPLCSGTVCWGWLVSLLLISLCFKTIPSKLPSRASLLTRSCALRLQFCTDKPTLLLKWLFPSAFFQQNLKKVLHIQCNTYELQVYAHVPFTAQHTQLPSMKQSNFGVLTVFTVSRYHRSLYLTRKVSSQPSPPAICEQVLPQLLNFIKMPPINNKDQDCAKGIVTPGFPHSSWAALEDDTSWCFCHRAHIQLLPVQTEMLGPKVPQKPPRSRGEPGRSQTPISTGFALASDTS